MSSETIEQIMKFYAEGGKQVDNFANMNNRYGTDIANAGLIQWLVVILIISLILLVLILSFNFGRIVKKLDTLADVMNAEKQYTAKDFACISPTSIENTILRINRRIDLIVDRNSITDNIHQIEADIKTLIDRETETGRTYLRSLGFKDNILNTFFAGTDIQKVKSAKALQDNFVMASQELDAIDTEKKLFRETVKNCDKDWRDILDKYDEFEEEKKKSYVKLKREIWTVFENNIYEIQQKINSFKGA